MSLQVKTEQVYNLKVTFRCKHCDNVKYEEGFISYMNYAAMARYLNTHRCACGNIHTVVTASYEPGYVYQ